MKVILILIMLSGLFVAVRPPLNKVRVVALTSDFCSFAMRVGQREDGKEILALGGESDQESFGDLIEKVQQLQQDPTATRLGILIVLLSGTGLGIDIWRTRNRRTT